MQFYLISGLVFALIVAIFALWNSTEIIIRFPLIGQFATSQALVIIGSATLGAVITTIFGLIKHVKMNFLIKKQIKTIAEYKDRIEKLEKEKAEKQSTEKTGPYSESGDSEAKSV